MYVPANFLEDRRIIERLVDGRSHLARAGVAVDIAALSVVVGFSPMQTLYAVAFHRVWNELGLDKDRECAGPHTTYH